MEQTQEANFYTKSGLLSAKMEESWIQLNFPATPEETTNAPEELIEALNIEPITSVDEANN